MTVIRYPSMKNPRTKSTIYIPVHYPDQQSPQLRRTTILRTKAHVVLSLLNRMDVIRMTEHEGYYHIVTTALTTFKGKPTPKLTMQSRFHLALGTLSRRE